MPSGSEGGIDVATQYSLTCINNSLLRASFALFQRPPEIIAPGDVYALAWFAGPSHPQTQVTFSWTMDHSFVCAETGVLQPDVTVAIAQTFPADPLGKNFIELTADNAGAVHFTEPSTEGRLGALTIRQAAELPTNQFSVGVGQSGSAAYLVQAAQNITTVFKPRPNYRVAFGHFQQGQVLDLETIANHRGSVLGLVPGSAQPTQKAFETALWHALRALDRPEARRTLLTFFPAASAAARMSRPAEDGVDE